MGNVQTNSLSSKLQGFYDQLDKQFQLALESNNSLLFFFCSLIYFFFYRNLNSIELKTQVLLTVTMLGKSDVFFEVENLHSRYFGGSRDLLRIFYGLYVCYID